jgi:hypothetical protein
MRVLGRNPAPDSLRRVEVDPSALESGDLQPAGDPSGPTRANPSEPEPSDDGSLSERILGGDSNGSQERSNPPGTNDTSTNQRSTPTSLSDVSETTQSQMPESTRENPGVTDVQGQLDNAAQVFLPALAVETGSRAATLITGGVATSSFVGQGTFQKVVEVGLPVVLGVATFMLGERMNNVYIKQSAVGMAIPAADALLNPILNPIESSLQSAPSGGGGNGGGSGQQGLRGSRAGMGYGEFLTEENMGMSADQQLPAGDGMGVDKSKDLVQESEEGSRFAKVSVDE